MNTIIRWVILFLAFVGLAVTGQQCSNARLEEVPFVNFSAYSSDNPFRLPPSEFVPQRRYVFMVDMSNSMISGPCPQDVDTLGMDLLFKKSPSFEVYDPNKQVGSATDHRASGVDCQVDTNLDYGQYRFNPLQSIEDFSSMMQTALKTHRGIDPEADRLSLIEQWVDYLIANSSDTLRANTKIMIAPVTGGENQKKMEQRIFQGFITSREFDFVTLGSGVQLKQILQSLRTIHTEGMGIVQSNNIWRFEKTIMGTTDLGTVLNRSYSKVINDMRQLESVGNLTQAQYEVIHVGDGLLNPQPQHVSDALTLNKQCEVCTGDIDSCPKICSLIVNKIESSWGIAKYNTPEQVDFTYSLMESLPEYFGAGYSRLNLVRLKKGRSIASRNMSQTNEKDYFDEIKPRFAARDRSLNVWDVSDNKIPFQLLDSDRSSASFKLTSLYVLNPNLRVTSSGDQKLDSDADGVFDDEESIHGTDPLLTRTYGVCLDSLYVNSAFKARCEELANNNGCDPQLDSDGDGLNECEESMLNTNPYDFDTDGDAIPDYFEVLYGFNPTRSDTEEDSNRDRYPNILHFASGLSPSTDFKSVTPDKVVSYFINYLGKDEFFDPNYQSKVHGDLNQVVVNYAPTKELRLVDFNRQVQMYLSRSKAPVNRIDEQHSLFNYTHDQRKNTILGLARVVNRSDPSLSYWWILKFPMTVNAEIVNSDLSLGQFKQMKVLDRNE